MGIKNTESEKPKQEKDTNEEKQDSSYDPFAANKWQHQYERYFGFDW